LIASIQIKKPVVSGGLAPSAPGMPSVGGTQPVHQQVLALLGPSCEELYKSTN
jgi:hypothetical protein